MQWYVLNKQFADRSFHRKAPLLGARPALFGIRRRVRIIASIIAARHDESAKKVRTLPLRTYASRGSGLIALRACVKKAHATPPGLAVGRNRPDRPGADGARRGCRDRRRGDRRRLLRALHRAASARDG